MDAPEARLAGAEALCASPAPLCAGQRCFAPAGSALAARKLLDVDPDRALSPVLNEKSGQRSGGRALSAITFISFRYVHLRHVYARGPEVPGKASPLGTRAFDADLGDLPEAPEPAEHAGMARRGGGELLPTPSRPPGASTAAATLTARWVSTPPATERGGPTIVIAIPSSLLAKGWHARPHVCGAGVIALVGQGDPPRLSTACAT